MVADQSGQSFSEDEAGRETHSPSSLRPTAASPEEKGLPAKLGLELDKLRLEIAALQRRWYQRSEYLSPLVTVVVAACTLFIAWHANLFDVNSKLLEIKKHDLTSDIIAFEQTKATLIATNKQLRNTNERLASTNTQLEHANNKLTLANQEQVRRGHQLESEVTTTELKTGVRALTGAPSSLSIDDPTFKRGL
jgi:hypothetical protein